MLSNRVDSNNRRGDNNINHSLFKDRLNLVRVDIKFYDFVFGMLAVAKLMGFRHSITYY